MALYASTPQRFAAIGLGLNAPPDAIPVNRYPFLQNVREYQLGHVTTRAGVTTQTNLAGAANSLARLNDSVAATNLRFYGLVDGTIYTEPVSGGGATLRDSAYSTNPITFVVDTPPRSPQPWIYAADSARQRKFNSSGTRKTWGLPQPLTAPSITLAQPAIKVINECNTHLDWTAVGTGGAAADGTPVNTTVASIIYDSGTSGNASIVPTAFTNIIIGARLTLNAAETVIVQQITVAIASTTIGQIVYDIGTSGLCTIQPAASLGVGQTVSPPLAAYDARYGAAQPIQVMAGASAAAAPAPDQTSVPVGRQIDFPVNCLVRINSGGGTDETVRILSVTVGTDGVQSFRCSTANTHAAGETLGGKAAFRCYTTTTIAATQTITAVSQTQALTPVFPSGASQVDMVGGLKNAIAVFGATVSSATLTRAVLEDDQIHVSLKVDAMQAVNGFRLYLDVDDNSFLKNYYFFEWRANDIISAIQATNAGAVDTVTAARLAVVTNQQVDPAVQAALAQAQAAAEAAGAGAAAGAALNITPTIGVPTTNPTVGDPTSLNSSSLQLTLANNQWITLRCRVGDLIRVGGDTTKTLDNITGAEILIDATSTATVANPLNAEYSAIYITGGFGPNSGDLGVSYAYVAVPRDGALGVPGNPSPPSRGGVIPRRQRVECVPPTDVPADASLIDWFRIGGLLDRWTYVGTSPNDGSTFHDDTADNLVTGGQGLTIDNFQPWPTTDLPRSGVAVVAGSAMQWVSGDTFNLNWAPGTPIVVNGFTVTIDQVLSSTRMLLHGNAGSNATANWTAANPTLMATPLPSCWGDLNGVYFACGDSKNPGSVYWCKRGVLDAASDRNNVLVTGGGEPLQAGYMWDVESYVASTNHIYRLLDRGDGFYIPILTAGTRGFWTRWSYCVRPEGCYFLAEDGIFLKSGGGVEVSITDADLYPLFPHDGTTGTTVNTIAPPDMTQTTRLRLSSVDRYLYFDYADTAGHDRTLIYDTVTQGWLLDKYASGIFTRLSEPGSGVHDQILATADATIKIYGGTSDGGSAIAGALYTRYVDGGAARMIKQFGDILVKADPALAASGISAQIVYNDGEQALSVTSFGAGVTGLSMFVLDVNTGAGVLARNLGLKLSWSESLVAPALELWDPTYLSKAEDIQQRATDWDDLGYAGAKFIQGVVIRANTYGVAKTLSVEYDGGTVALTLSANHNGEIEIAYPLASAGWTPFLAQLVRLVGDDTPWQLYGLRWVFEPAPEAATEWHTQPTTHDLPGYMSVRDIVLAYSADDPVTLSLQYDNQTPQTYPLPATAGAYSRDYLILQAGKGRSVTYKLTAATPFRLYQRDCSVRVQPWGGVQGYGVYNPFGGPSRQAGAEI